MELKKPPPPPPPTTTTTTPATATGPEMTEALPPSAPQPSLTRRDRIINEIVSSERTFVINLETVLEVFIKPLSGRPSGTTAANNSGAKSTTGKPILNKDEIQELFSTWELLVSWIIEGN